MLFSPERSGTWNELPTNLTTADSWVDYQQPVVLLKNEEVLHAYGMFIRSAYIQIYDAIARIEGLKNKSPVNCAVSGTPGIGKTIFGLYVVLRKVVENLLEEEREAKVVIQYWTSDQGLQIEIEPQLNELTTSIVGDAKLDFSGVAWVISDPLEVNIVRRIKSKLSTHPKAIFVLVMSPSLRFDPGDGNDLLSRSAAKIILPPWKQDEISRLFSNWNREFLIALAEEDHFLVDLESMLQSKGENGQDMGFFDLVETHLFQADMIQDATNFKKNFQERKRAEDFQVCLTWKRLL